MASITVQSCSAVARVVAQRGARNSPTSAACRPSILRAAAPKPALGFVQAVGRGCGAVHLQARKVRNAVSTRRAFTSTVMADGSKGRALISVFDKTGLPELAKGLEELGYEVVSTGGSAKAVADAGVAVKQVDEITSFPEMLGGRVKTLHPAVHGGILAKRADESHMATLKEHNIGAIDIVAGNLYPFRETVASGAEFAACIENIDIGGPTMLRAAAKNHQDVMVVVDPADYPVVLDALKGGMSADEEMALRKRLAWKAFQHCASYDSQVAEWLWNDGGAGNGEFPPEMSVPMTLMNTLRYGENAHQAAAVYSDKSLSEMSGTGVASATLHHGKEMSYNNYLDAEAAYSAVCDLQQPSCVIVKHTNPCGVASRDDLLEAYRLAVIADPISAFGGIVAFNQPLTEELARELREYRSPTDGETRMFYEIVIAPSYTPEGLATLKGKSKALRILEAQPRESGARSLRQVGGGWLYQDVDALKPSEITFTCVTEKQATDAELADLKFAWTTVKHVKSNAITICKDMRMLGMGSGQPNRVESVKISLAKAGEDVKGSVMASDAFFPFSWNDSVEKACQAGVAAIVHPGGSMRDVDAVECCNKYGVALYTTDIRHFRH